VTEQSTNDSPAATYQGLTWRVVALGIVLTPINVYWVLRIETIPDLAHSTTLSLFFTAVYTLIVVCAINWLLRAIAPRFALSQSELLLTYSMVCVGSAMASHDFIAVLIPLFTWSFWMANPTNKWDTLINPHMPEWLTIRDPNITRGFYEGGVSLYQADILLAWARPIAMWTGFIIILVAVMLCLNSLVRRRWLDDEHLACPLVYLPVEISQPRPTLFRTKLFWIGFAIAGSIQIWNRVGFFYPILPTIQIEPVNMAAGLRDRPWNAVDILPRSFHPFLIGLGYLMPSDFLFSFWFFYLFWKAQLVFGAMVGLDRIRDYPFSSSQGFGAYVLFGLYAVWLARDYLKELYQAVLGERTRLSDEREPLPYRAAMVGVILGLGGLVWFSMAMGMRVWVAVVFFIIYYVLGLSITRMRAQFAVPIHSLLSHGGATAGAPAILASVFGTRSFPKGDLVGMANYYWFNRAFRGHSMPHQMEAMKMQDQTAHTSKGTVPALLIAALVGSLAAFWAILHLYYSLGATAKGGMNMWIPRNFEMLSSWLVAPQGPQWGAVISIGIGALIAFFLQAMRMRFVNWPFHPLAYAISGDTTSNYIWMPLMIAWAIKSVIVKYGSHKLYQRLMPLFMGLILGEFMVGGSINLGSLALNLRRPFFYFVP